jgi:hypothetical protein
MADPTKPPWPATNTLSLMSSSNIYKPFRKYIECQQETQAQ